MMIEEFRNQLLDVLDLPTKPDVQAYYKKHISEYQRKAAALAAYSEDLPTSHSPMLSAPDLLAKALQRVVARIP